MPGNSSAFGQPAERRRSLLITKLPYWQPKKPRVPTRPSLVFCTNLDKVASLLVSLPFELRELILNELSWRDVIHLRVVCKSLFYLVHTHGAGITQHLIQCDSTVTEANSLFKNNPAPPRPKLDDIFALLRRSSMVDHLAHMVATHQLTQVYYNSGGNAQAKERHVRQINITVRNLRPHLMIISHMLECYRLSLAALVKDVDLTGFHSGLASSIRVKSWRKEIAILRQYNQDEMCWTSLVFEHLKKVLCRQLRPASYATYVERRVRGWTKPAASDEQVVSLMIFGGVEGINRFMRFPTYNSRIDALQDGLKHYTKGIPQAISPILGKEGSSEQATSQVPSKEGRLNHLAGSPPATPQFPGTNDSPQSPHTIPRINTTLFDPLQQIIIDRMRTVIPDRVRFFNLLELGKLVGANDVTSRAMAQPAPTGFLTMLQSDNMAFDFELRNGEPQDPDVDRQEGVKERPDRRRARLYAP
ncbi:MAG: hypothetical protein Q9218_004505 [Villophora microphyllina]